MEDQFPSRFEALQVCLPVVAWVNREGAELEMDYVIGHQQTGEGRDWQPFDPLWRWLHQLALPKSWALGLFPGFLY